MRIRHLFVVVVATLFSNAAQAQIHSSTNSKITITKEKIIDTTSYNRIYLGYSGLNASNLSTGSVLNRFRGGELGYLRGINLSKKASFFLEIGGRVSMDINKKVSDEGQKEIGVTMQRSLLSLTVPVSLTYKAMFPSRFYVAPYIGPQLRINMMGKDKVTINVNEGANHAIESTYDLFDSEDTDPTLKRGELGVQAGLNFGIKRINFGVGYYIDSPIYKKDSEKVNLHGLSGTIGINF